MPNTKLPTVAQATMIRSLLIPSVSPDCITSRLNDSKPML